jgi:hypothetical protein
MPRPQRPWFRFYVEALSDRKLRRLTPAQRWLWVAVLGAARQSPVPGVLLVSDDEPMDPDDLADIAGMTRREVVKALPLFERAGMIDRDDDLDAWRVTNWGTRQWESDDTTERTRKHRRRNVPTTAVGTPPETEADTDPSPQPPGPSPEPTPTPAGGIIEQAVELAAKRYGQHEQTQGRGRAAEGLASYWLQQNATGARERARALLADYDLGLTQLADALTQPNPRWLESFRRRTPAGAAS